MQIKQPEGLTKGNFKSTNCQNGNGKGNHIKTTGFHSRFFPNVWHPGAFPSSSSRHGPRRVSHRARRGVLRIQHGSASAAASLGLQAHGQNVQGSSGFDSQLATATNSKALKDFFSESTGGCDFEKKSIEFLDGMVWRRLPIQGPPFEVLSSAETRVGHVPSAGEAGGDKCRFRKVLVNQIRDELVELHG